jgi:glycosyltransferase involved in cell wall biosynthesis
MKAADVFILNSSYEGLPHILLEAFAAGLPVVATTAGGTGEVVENGVNGLLVPPRRKDLLADAVEGLLSDGDMRKALIKGGRRVLLERFRWKTMVDETEAELLTAVKGKRAGR